MTDTSPEQIVYELLTTDQGVGAIVADRVYPHHAADTETYPFIIYQRVSTDRGQLMGASDGLVKVRMQIDLYGVDHDQMQVLAEAVRLFFGSYHGQVGQSSVRRTWLDSESEDYIAESDGSDDGTFRRTIDIMMAYTETATSLS